MESEVEMGPGVSGARLNIRAWPNPVNQNSVLNIECRISNIEYRSVELKIHDVTGRMVHDLSFEIRRSAFGVDDGKLKAIERSDFIHSTFKNRYPITNNQ